MAYTYNQLRNTDPIQGHDVWVSAHAYSNGTTAATDQTLENAFTDIMFKVVNQTEAYLPLFSRVPRYLDGEVIIVWQCAAGALSFDFVEQTFGESFTASIENGRTTKVPRSKRFTLNFYVDTTGESTGEHAFNNTQVGNKAQMMKLLYCRCDSLSFGVQAGKSFAINAWQGTAEGLDDGDGTAIGALTEPPSQQTTTPAP